MSPSLSSAYFSHFLIVLHKLLSLDGLDLGLNPDGCPPIEYLGLRCEVELIHIAEMYKSNEDKSTQSI